MKNTLRILPIRWILRVTIISIISLITGLNFWWCLLAYVGIMLLIRFSLNIMVVILGFALMVGVFLVLFLGLLAL